MRMIDRFRTPSQQKIIRWLEANHKGTMMDIVRGAGLYHLGGSCFHHVHALIEDGVIHICGYIECKNNIGCKNIPVYALCSRRCP